MGQNTDLKQRFLKLQQQELTAPIVNDVSQKIELMDSNSLNIHEAVMNCTDSKIYDWKRAYRDNFQRPTLDESCDPVVQVTQGQIQSLVKKPVLISFHYSQCLNSALNKLNSYMTSRPQFWSQVLAGAGQIHIRSSKNKLQLWIRNSDESTRGTKELKALFENEYMTNFRQLKAFNVQKFEEWIELNFDINEKTVDIRDKEASV
jgi:succinate dehydrogenase flavin-adding protein (antitoxin of CptAB toxin-antitoxin module)